MNTYRITFKDDKAVLIKASDFSVNTLTDIVTLTEGNIKVALYRYCNVKSIERVESV